MAKPVPVTLPPKREPVVQSDEGYWPRDLTERDYFRLKRVANGWQVEMTRLSADLHSVESIRSVHAWDRYEMSLRRLEQLATEFERMRR